MLSFSALVAGSFSLGSMAANEIAPAALNIVRFVIAAAIMGTVAAATGNLRGGVPKAPWRYLVLGAIFASYFVLMFEGLKTAAPVSASAVFTLTPVMSGVFGWLLLRQVTTPRMALALAIGAVGALWVIFRADLSALLALEIGRGELIYFVGCVAHAAYTPLLRKLNRGEPGVVMVFYVLLGGIVAMLAWGWETLLQTDWIGLPAIAWIAILYTAVIASALTFTLLQFSTQRLPSAKVMAYTYLTPSWVILWEIALGNDVPRPMVLVGVTATVLALVLLLKDEDA
ncbi:DMT family transporter [Anianabacter salinae]|uniref:DMT family transporter n=1 Tax=Anianabacter salinae TaxID=2851023 RepID=UPI00225E4291|nr:DMT family transporter [Anianabacter salinae]MBV0910968.1 DMT family transporter [Anianabacter salinae]